MLKHIILFFPGLIFLFSCDDNQETKGVLPAGQMAGVLVDMHIVDGSLVNQPVGDSLYKYGTGKYFFVFKQHHTDSAQFNKSFNYYTRHTDEGAKVYDVVIKTLEAKADSMNKLVTKDNEITRKRVEAQQRKIEKAKADSLTKKGIKVPPSGINTIGDKAREEMSKPRPMPAPLPGHQLKGFKRGI
jgi:hypothetical protein